MTKYNEMATLKTLLITSIMLFTSIFAYGQASYDKETFDDAEYFFAQDDYQEALVSYLRLYKRGFKENANINYKIGVCYLNLNIDREKAVPYLEFAVTKTSLKYKEGLLKEDNAPIDAFLFLGNAYRINMQHDKAIDAYSKYLEISTNIKDIEPDRRWAQSQIEACKRAKNATNKLVRVKYTPLGKPINTNTANFNAVVSADESSMVFLTKQRFYSAIMHSQKSKGKWGIPKNITPQIMSDGDQYPVFLSADGKTLLLAKYMFDNCDLFISTFNGKTWTASIPFPKEINGKFWESHACLSPDGKTLYLVSNRNQSIGGTDIFVSELKADGKWTTPINLGSTINTPLNEETPFISPDGNTLYFSSQGFESIGGYDIYYSKKEADGQWGKPVNMGYPINTTDDDLFFAPTGDPHFAYQAKAIKGGLGDLDIVRIELFSKDHPYKFNLNGNVTELLPNEKPENYKVILLEQLTQKRLDSIKPQPNGDFSFERVAGTYILRVESDDFFTNGAYFIVPENYPSENYFITPEIAGFTNIYNDYLAEKKLGKKWKQKPVEHFDQGKRPSLIHNILFSFAESSLTRDAENQLDTIAKLMIENPDLEIELTGHTDAQGSEQFNQTLSEKRAVTVQNWLLDKGVKNNRLNISGKGELSPIAINENPDGSDNPIGRAFNRRVEFKIVKSSNPNIRVESIKVPKELLPTDVVIKSE